MGSGGENDQVISGVCCLKTCSQGVCLAFLWKCLLLSWGLHRVHSQSVERQMAQRRGQDNSSLKLHDPISFCLVISFHSGREYKSSWLYLSSLFQLGVRSLIRKTQYGVDHYSSLRLFLTTLCLESNFQRLVFRFLSGSPNATFCHKG